MRIPGRKGLGIAFRWARSRFQGRALILGYHRIAPSDFDPYDLCVSPENFRQQLEEMLSFAKPIRLSQLVTGLATKRVEPGTVALTFDDAYLEALQVVEPILAEYDIPATVFVTTSTLGQELWWDRLRRILFTPAVLPKQLGIGIGSFVFDWASGPRPGPDDGSDPRQGRNELLMNLYRCLLFASKEDRERALEQLREWAGVSGEASPDSRVVSGKELVELAGSPLIDIGSHTVSHPTMARLSPLATLRLMSSRMTNSPSGLRTRLPREVVDR